MVTDKPRGFMTAFMRRCPDSVPIAQTFPLHGASNYKSTGVEGPQARDDPLLDKVLDSSGNLEKCTK